MKKLTYSFLSLFIALACLSSCKKDDTTTPRQDVYTTVSLKFTNKANASDVKTITYTDLDGNGPLLPTFSTLELKPFAEYAVQVITIKDESVNPQVDLLDPIKRDSRNYLFVYGVAQANLGFFTTDLDTDNKRFGVEARANTGMASTGNFNFKLVKNPISKEKADAEGEVKFQYTFPVKIVQ